MHSLLRLFDKKKKTWCINMLYADTVRSILDGNLNLLPCHNENLFEVPIRDATKLGYYLKFELKF